jgi:hypothetical protein
LNEGGEGEGTEAKVIQDREFERPMMGKVVQILEGLVEVDTPPMPRLLEAIAGRSHSTCT